MCPRSGEDFLARGGVPELHRAVTAGGGDAAAVGAERHAVTAAVCPRRVRTSWPVAASQSFTVRSELAEAMRRPSGLNATPMTRMVVPAQGEDFLAGGGVPELHRAVPAGGGDAAAVGAERHAADTARVPAQGEHLLAGGGVPELHRRTVLAGGGDAAAVGAERHAADCPPNVRASVRTSWPVAASQSFTVLVQLAEAMRRPSGLNATLLTPSACPREVNDFLARDGVPELHRAVRPSRRRRCGGRRG